MVYTRFFKVNLAMLAIAAILTTALTIREVYIGDFYPGEQLIYAPPYKSTYIISIYDVSTGSLSLTRVTGITLSIQPFINQYSVVSIKGCGIDVYILLINIIIMLDYYYMVWRRQNSISPLRAYSKLILYYILLALTAIYVVLTYTIYPYSTAYIVSLDKPLMCDNVMNRELCVVDRFQGGSIINIEVNDTANLLIFFNNSLIYNETTHSGFKLTRVFENNGEYVVALMKSIGEESDYMYRRVYIAVNSDLGSIYLVTFSSTIILLVNIALSLIKGLTTRIRD